MQHKTTRDLANEVLKSFKDRFRTLLVEILPPETTLGEINKLVENGAAALTAAQWDGEGELCYHEFIKNQSYKAPKET